MVSTGLQRRNLFLAAALVTGLVPFSAAQSDWSANGGDAANTRFSRLDQIKPANVANLKPVWTWDSGEAAPEYEVTPLVVGHVMYVSTPHERVVALNADTGKQIWAFDPKVENYSTHRGVSYWPGDKQNPPRIIVGTSTGQIYALDAASGKLVSSFGNNGEIDYRAGFPAQYQRTLYGFSSPPAVYKDLIIFGPRTAESGPKGPDASIRALDVRTGKEVWTFHTLPRPGEPGYDTWGPDFYKNGAGPSAWAGITLDTQRGIVFIPVGNPTGGGDPAGRTGNDLYSDSIVALNADSGKLLWYFQTTHHDVWDYDVTAPPTLIDVVQNGKTIPAVAQMTKQGLLFILDRVTGKPVFGVEERPVPASVTDDKLSPTQPFPIKPTPLAKNSMSVADVSRITPEAEKYCTEEVESHDVGGPFLPRGGARGTIVFPSSIGGGNWGGISYDKSLGLVFTNTSNLGARSNAPANGGGRPAATSSATPAPISPASPQSPASPATIPNGPNAANAPVPRNTHGGPRFTDESRYPCNAPPWGVLSAVNVNTGDIAWQVPLGSYKELEDKGIKNTGTPNLGPSLVTASGLVLIGATNDSRFRAFDAHTGKLLWQTDLEGDVEAQPITYQNSQGKQLLAITIGGSGLLGGVGPVPADVSGKITAFGLSGGSTEAASSTHTK